MTIISHKYRFVFLKTRKTAGSSIEGWLAPLLGERDMIATAAENWPVRMPFWSTSDPTTRFTDAERKFKKRVKKTIGGPRGLQVREHMSAARARALLGEDLWRGYYKFCVERDPWDRMISFWRWRQRRFGSSLTLDEFLDLLERDPQARLVRHFSNLHIYTIDDRLAVDRVIHYKQLNEGLAEVCAHLGIAASVDDLPRHKAGVRPRNDDVLSLDAAQIERVGRLAAREIELLGWPPPQPAGPAATG
jgi:hypothetical protein